MEDYTNITINVTGYDGRNTDKFTLFRRTKFVKLMKEYCRLKNLGMSKMRFLFDGVGINFEDTPQSLGMVDEDTIVTFKWLDVGFDRGH